MVKGVGGSGVGGLGFGFGSVWLRDLGMQLCFGFSSDVFAKLHIYLIKPRRGGYQIAAPGNWVTSSVCLSVCLSEA